MGRCLSRLAHLSVWHKERIMNMIIGGKRCVIQSFELDDDIFEIDDRAEFLYINMGVEFESGIIYHDFKYFFETKELRIGRAIEDERIMYAFIKEHLVTILGRVLFWNSEDNRASRLYLGDRVMVKKSLTLSIVTGIFDKAEPYFELDSDFEVDYSSDELIKWGAMPKGESESMNYRELKSFNIALDKVEFEDMTVYDVIHEYHDGDMRVKRFKGVDRSYTEVYEEALNYFKESIEEVGE